MRTGERELPAVFRSLASSLFARFLRFLFAFFVPLNESLAQATILTILSQENHASPGPYLGFFVCGGKLGFREISDQYSYKKQPSKIRHYVRKKTFSFPGGGNCPLRPPAMYGPDPKLRSSLSPTSFSFPFGICAQILVNPASRIAVRSRSLSEFSWILQFILVKYRIQGIPF